MTESRNQDIRAHCVKKENPARVAQIAALQKAAKPRHLLCFRDLLGHSVEHVATREG